MISNRTTSQKRKSIYHHWHNAYNQTTLDYITRPMPDLNTSLKLNGLIGLLFGTLSVFIPQQVIIFLSDTNPAPEVAVVGMGVVFNLYGLLLLWLGNQKTPAAKGVLLIALGNGLWVLMTAGLVVTTTWITTINGITAAGLMAILVGWFGWSHWQYFAQEHSA